MATNDLMTELQKDSIKLDDDSERKVVKMILKLLEDKNGEVQNLAVKWYVFFFYGVKNCLLTEKQRVFLKKRLRGLLLCWINSIFYSTEEPFWVICLSFSFLCCQHNVTFWI